MTEVYRFSDSELLLFFMLMVRMTAFTASWPVFGVETISPQLKILFGVVLTMVVFPTLTFSVAQMEFVKSDLVLLAMREAAIGLSIGYLGRFFFFAFRVAGEMISQAMGLGAAQMFNPALGGQASSIESLYVGLATLFYLGVNGHHFLIKGLVSTCHTLQVATLSFNTSQFTGVGHMMQDVIELGLKLSAPVVVSILVVNLVLGVIGKTVPQLNVLVTSFPINILVGFGLMMITLPMLMDNMGEFLNESTIRIFQFVKTF
jgi:flagellar biosynthesis protein FliR